MKTKKRYNTKFLENFRKVLLQHVNSNLKDYLVLSIVFVIGVIIGVILINNSNEQSKTEISGYINGFVDTIKNNQFVIDKFKLIQISILENIKIIILIWIAGSTIIGMPLIYVITAYKGFCIGYTVSAIICSLGAGKRNGFFPCRPFSAKYYCDSYNFNA